MTADRAARARKNCSNRQETDNQGNQRKKGSGAARSEAAQLTSHDPRRTPHATGRTCLPCKTCLSCKLFTSGGREACEGRSWLVRSVIALHPVTRPGLGVAHQRNTFRSRNSASWFFW